MIDHIKPYQRIPREETLWPVFAAVLFFTTWAAVQYLVDRNERVADERESQHITWAHDCAPVKQTQQEAK